MSKASTLRSDLRRFDPLDLAAGCAALSMLPANWGSAYRLHGLCSYVLSESPSRCGSLRHDGWQRWIRDLGALAPLTPWDPPEGLWTEPVLFYGGSYVLVTGGEPGVVPALQSVLDVVALADWPREASAYRRRAIELAQAVLVLGHGLSFAAGLSRYMTAGPSSPLTVPAARELARRSADCSLSAAELEELIGAPATVLSPLTYDLADGPMPTGTPERDPLERTPIIRRGDRYVVAWPHALGVALKHALLVLAGDAGVEGELGALISDRSVGRVAASAERMNWRLLRGIQGPAELPLHSVLFSIDRDKLAHVALISDDLTGYDVGDPRGWWAPSVTPTQMLERMNSVEEMYGFGPSAQVNEFVHIVVLAGLGRSMSFGLPDLDTLCGAPQLLLTDEAFCTISMLGADQLELLKFARASDRLRARTRVMAFDAIDEYQMWRDHDRAFYFGDDRRPDLVSVDPSYGRAIGEEVARTTDVHAMRNPDGAIEPVILLNGDRGIPIYVPLHDPSRGPRFATVGGDCTWWTLGETAFLTAAHRFAALAMTDCLAYWLWQTSRSLPEFSWLDGDVITINVVVASPDQWDMSTLPEPSGQVAEAKVSSDLSITVTVFPAMASRMDAPDNAAERELVRVVLCAVSQLDREHGGSGLSEDEIDLALERHAPLGPKKKINVYGTADRPDLRDGALPPARLRQDADISDALDKMSTILLPRLSTAPGPLAPEARVPALKSAVAIHFDHLAALVATLNPVGLLEDLVARHEALVFRNAKQDRTLGARIACFGGSSLVEDMIKELPEVNSTGVSLRFLIEYVTTCPPSGLRPMSVGLYDELVAHAGEIVNRGMTADALEYGLDDFDVSILESGRLGVSRDGAYYTGQKTYLETRVPIMARQTAAAYGRHWEPRSDERPEFADALDAAAKAEFGFTITQLAELSAELVNAAESRSGEVAVERRSVLLAELSDALGWERKDVDRALDLLTLTPRKAFLDPPAPFARADVYPWLFNRSLSYLRKPLLARPLDGEQELVWGMRQVWVAGRYLVGLIAGERLKARSREMKQFMTQLRQQEAAAFNRRVAKLCESNALTVRTNVRTVNGQLLARTVAGGRKEAIGDIDVLAADVAQRRLLVLECKDLEGARTPSELRNEINYTFGVGRHKKSKLENHVERIDWVEHHLVDLLHMLGIDTVDGWTIDGRMVTDIEVLAPHVLGVTPIPVVSIASLEAEFASAETE